MYSFNQTLISFYSSAERLKRDFDKAFGAPWNVIVGECYSFDIDYDFHFVFYFLYGPVAILAWRGRGFFLSPNLFPYHYFKLHVCLSMFFVHP